MDQVITQQSGAEPPPRWWWWARVVVATAAVAAPLAAMTESMSYAMSYPYSTFIAMLGPHDCPHDVSIWRELPEGTWAERGDGFLASAGGAGEVTPWLWLTDWLWLAPIAVGVALLNTALFPSWSWRAHVRLSVLGAFVAAAVYGIYLLAFVYGTDYPIAIAQREIGIRYAAPTLAIGAAQIVVTQPLVRAGLRWLVTATRQPAARELFIGLYRGPELE